MNTEQDTKKDNSLRFEAEPKPEINDNIEIMPDTSEFSEPDKAKAIIKYLDLKMGDTIKESGDEFIINSKMVLQRDTPEHYKLTIENLKKILTKQEIKDITNYIKRKKENEKVSDKIYNAIEKITDKFYYRQEIKKSVKGEIRDILLFFKDNNHCGLNNTIYHLLSKENADYVKCYHLAWNNKPIPNIQTWREENEGEYLVLTDEEADSRAKEYAEDDEDIWKEAVRTGNTTSGFDDWVEEQISDRASVLNHYDGKEESEDIGGTTYYIYRTN